MRVVGQVEIDPFCRRVLEKHWPEVPRHDDVRTTVEWWRSEPRPAVHLVAGGPPCQPTSQAGPKLAQSDPRWLWPEMAVVVDAFRPTWVIVENVPGLRSRGLADVLGDLAGFGYRARAGVAAACAVSASHARPRVLVLAHAAGEGRCPWGVERGAAAREGAEPAAGRQPERRSGWPVEPGVGRVAYGVPSGVDRRRALGNAVVPQVAEYVGRLIVASAQRNDLAS